MSQLFNHNGFIVLKVDHDSFEQTVTYTVQWDELPLILENSIVPTYRLVSTIHGADGYRYYIEVSGRQIELASDKSGLTVFIGKTGTDSKIYWNNELLTNVVSANIYLGTDNTTKATLEVLVDKVTGNVGAVNFKQRKIILDKETNK
jgi:hypothetical protein